MKHIFFSIIIFLLLPIVSFSQDKATIAIFKADDINALKILLEDQPVNECMDDYTLLAMSIKTNAINSFQHLINNGADVDAICKDKTPLMYTAKYGRIDMARILLDKGADFKKKSNRGKSLMQYCKKYKQPKLVEILQKMAID